MLLIVMHVMGKYHHCTYRDAYDGYYADETTDDEV
jgi:hypothetical protein